MKDRDTIIQSGMLEQYFLGTLPKEQIAALEKMLAEDEILAVKYSEIETDFENIAFENAVQPPNFIKNNLFVAIQDDDPKVKTLPKEEPPAPKSVNPKVLMWIAAGIAAIFMVSSLWMFTQWNTAQDNLQVTQQELNTIKQQIANLEGNLKDSQLLAEVVKDPNTLQYALKGNDKIPGGLATAYINHESKSAVVNAQKLPALPADKTYQMWADVDGEMINMGIIDKSKDVVILQYIDEAASLNITIEPAGGSDHATVAQLVTNVYL
ncbi:anti-sigma factor [Kordia sp. YSTF-M3]|uniref:Anti-sigma factor n=1 Tax=Kordia aestuariivivens TaxID=2759037 RepID=A0ABR7Q8W2_9FLAO|nr:anti-sigma factor [Kordia aestuariivivens]MBC8754883.1 anti-sigma factor [Kordia aestuariivivens]